MLLTSVYNKVGWTLNVESTK